MNWKLAIKIPFLIVALILSSVSYAETVWIDVRSSIEHAIDHIEGDVRISHGDIVKEVEKLFPKIGVGYKLKKIGVGYKLKIGGTNLQR